MSGIILFLKNSRVVFVQAYLLIMSTLYPLYITGSYQNIGKDKYFFYKFVTLSMLTIVSAGSVLYSVCSGFSTAYLTDKNRVVKRRRERLTSTEWSVILFVGAMIFSFFMSPYRETAWTGSEGWFMGLGTLLLITTAFFCISRIWDYSGYVWIGFMTGSMMVCLLGICNRFSVYPVRFDVVAPDFISTLGNINWFCGYLSVLWPIGACFYLYSEKLPVRMGAGFFTVIAFGGGLTQGSSSFFLSLGAVFYFLLFTCFGHWATYGRRLLELVVYGCLTCQAIRLLRSLFPGSYNYEINNLCGYVTGSSLSLYVMGGLLLLYAAVFFYYKNKVHLFYNISNKKHLGTEIQWIPILILLPVGGLTAYFLLVAVNTLLSGGIPGLSDHGLFVFDQYWGNARGATWSTGWELFMRMDWRQKIGGVGPDCFADYLYMHPDLVEKTSGIFNGAVLKNAHNEWITMLVNSGLVGLATYMSIFVAVMVRFIRAGKRDPILYIPAVCTFSYMIHNMVSFGQVLNMPFLFIILGIGESYIRKLKRRADDVEEISRS